MAEPSLTWGDRWQDEIFRVAAERLPAPVFRHFTQGAREGVTAREAQQAWSRVRFAPHVLRDVRTPSISTSLLGQQVASPIGIAPTSMKQIADPDGEVAMARAAAANGTLLVVPSNTSTPFAHVGATGVHWWLQLYLTEDRDLVRPVLEAAHAAGARAVVLTLDTPVVGTKYDAPLPVDPRERANHSESSRDRSRPGAAHAQDIGAADVEWLARVSGLPVVVKGVLRPDDARRCVAAGAAAIWVSTHGGRQLDRVQSTADALPRVVASLGSETEVYVDGGVHNGLDTLAALSLGARGVFLGRLPLLALAAGGDVAVGRTLENLQSELLEAMKLAGCCALSEIGELAVSGG